MLNKFLINWGCACFLTSITQLIGWVTYNNIKFHIPKLLRVIGMNPFICMGLKVIASIVLTLTRSTESTSTIFPGVIDPSESNVTFGSLKLCYGKAAVWILTAIQTPSCKKTSQFCHCDAKQLLFENMIHAFLKIRNLPFQSTHQPLSNLTKEHATFCSWIYKDVIFDTSPVAGKVYKNSENRRKQGVSCGFRCICRCSICPVIAQPRCA